MFRSAIPLWCVWISACSLDWGATPTDDTSGAQGAWDGGADAGAPPHGDAGESSVGDAGDATNCSTAPDQDRDGARAVACGGDDCDDGDARRFPGNKEQCDGLDNDCDAVIDDAAAAACPAVSGGEALCNQGGCAVRCLDADSVPNEEMTSCVKIDHCRGVSACAPGTCLEGTDDYTCDCPNGFEGDGTKACGCPLGTRLSEDGQTCRAPAWTEPLPPFELATAPTSLAFVRADDGSAALVWGEGYGNKLRGVSYLPASGWSFMVHELGGVEPGLVVAEALPGGGAVCLMTKGSSSGSGAMPKLYSTILRPGGFESTKQHDQEFWDDGSYSPRLAGNGSGHVVATWYTYDTPDIRAHAFVDEFIDGMGWLGAQQQAEGPEAPFAAIDDDGRAVLAYKGTFAIKQSGTWGPFRPSASIGVPIAVNNAGQGVGGAGSLSHFSFEEGWSAPEAISGNDAALTRIDAAGRILTVWPEGNEVRYRYYSEGTWSKADAVFVDSYPPKHLRLSMNSHGDALAAWVPDQSFPMVRAQLFVAGLGWQFVQVVHMGASPSDKPLWIDVKIDEDGNALMVWLAQGADESNGPRVLHTATFR